MRLMHWLASWSHRTPADVASRHERSDERWLAEEERRQLQEVRDRLERVEDQLKTIATRRTP